MDKVDLKRLSFEELDAFVKNLGWKKYRAQQLRDWLYRKRVSRFDAMTNLSKPDRDLLESRAVISRLDLILRQRSVDGTQKFLFRLSDGQAIESVLIPEHRGGAVAQESSILGATEGPRYNVGGARHDATDPGGGRGPVYNDRQTLCISTQVGCTLDCRFCLTGTMGLIRNLKAHEIVDQVLWIQTDLAAQIGTESPVVAYDRTPLLTNVVLMGMGEPLANYREVTEALTRLTHPKMIGLSPRRITLSTAGFAPQIKKLGESGLNVNLAVSLNATTNAVRDRVMPMVNKPYPLEALLSACRAYPLPPRRKIFFEYVLLNGVNDTEADARRLLRLLKGIPCKVNLILFNDYPGAPFGRPDDETVLRFQKILIEGRLTAFIRKSRGRDILAACGQLRTETAAAPAVARRSPQPVDNTQSSC